MASKSVLQALGIAVEITGAELSEGAMRAMAADLSTYPEEQVLGALVRCRRECRHRLTLADILQRIDDGRPGPEEAWAMVPRDESQSVVWTDEIAEAWGVARGLIEEGDNVAARVAFLEHYRAGVQRARDEGLRALWWASLGDDKFSRESVLGEAVRLGRLPAGHLQQLLPHSGVDGGVVEKLAATLFRPATQESGE